MTSGKNWCIIKLYSADAINNKEKYRMKVITKKFKKVVSVLLLLIIVTTVLPNYIHVKAKETDDFKVNLQASVESLLSTVDLKEDETGLNNSNKNLLYVGEAIPTYFIEEGHVKLAEVEYYPLIKVNKLLGLFGVVSVNNEIVSMNYSSVHTDILNDFIKSNKTLAFIGDKYNFNAISSNESLALIGNKIELLSKEIIEYAPIENSFKVEVNNDNASSDSYTILSGYSGGVPVPSKKQQTQYNCWAASVASVGQFKKGIVKDSNGVCISIGHYGYGTSAHVEAALLKYGISSTTKNANGNFTFMYLKNKIDNSNPVIGGFMSTAAVGHMVVISGYGSSSQHASYSYMDPTDGGFYTSSIINDGYLTFVSGSSVYSLILWVE